MSTVLLIVDDNEIDRQALASSIADAATEVHAVGTPEEAIAITNGMQTVTAVIASIPDTNGESVFQFRDHLVNKFKVRIPAVFCSRSDMTAYYSKLTEGDKLFYKPIEIPVLREWLTETIGPAVVQQTAPSQAPAGAPGPIDSYDEALPEGIQLGDYKLERSIQRDNDFAIYEAEQTSIGRKVAIKTLYRKHRKDPAWVQTFVNEASARARVNHPNVSLVYECIQETGVNFYTLELVDAPSLASLSASGAAVSDKSLQGILEACCSALEYFRKNQMQHRMLTADTILLQDGEQTRIANPVKEIGAPLSAQEELQQMQHLQAALIPLLASASPKISSLVNRLGSNHANGIKSISQLRTSLAATSPQVGARPANTAVAADTQKKIDELKKKQANKRTMIIGTLAGLLFVAGLVVGILKLTQKPPEIREFSDFVRIPGGAFTYQEIERLQLKEFWIAKHEVTIAQYAEFLQWTKAEPSSLAKIQHPDQPDSKTSHTPSKWTAMYKAAQKGGKFLGAKIDPNYPISGIDWWDAFAYARFRDARLPTEEEWEKAARGKNGSKYPWGSKLDRSAFNSGVDQQSKEGSPAGSVDGYQYWSPVDGIPTDVSNYDVVGMAGNISEWTSSWDTSNKESPVPIKRGASFGTPKDFESSVRRTADPSDRNSFTGIRIASDIKPGSDDNYQHEAPKSILDGPTEPEPEGSTKTAASSTAATATPKAPEKPKFVWDSADGDDPFKTVFATPAK